MGKHLSLTDRALIERCLVHDFTFASIARKLSRSPTTISREVKNHRVFSGQVEINHNDCVEYIHCRRRNRCIFENKYSCFAQCKSCDTYDCRTICEAYHSKYCKQLDKPPYVCTSCPQQKKCKRIHAYYTSHRAHAEYQKVLKQSRKGIRATPGELHEIGELITPLIFKGQSINHIFSTHAKDIHFSERTIYNYIDQNAFKVKNIDLPKKVRYKKRRHQRVLTRIEYRCRRGRTYADFENYLELHPETPVVEMDTVLSARGTTKSLLTMIFKQNSFMLIYLMNDRTQKSVITVFDSLTKLLGPDIFRKLFPVILTDNGVEFKNPDALEHTSNGYRRTRIFYCDPQASWQKPHIEKSHVLIRCILPKRTSFAPLRQEDINLIVCHVNSVARELLGNKTPFSLLKGRAYKKLLDSLGLSPIAPDEVHLKPALIKH